jgi:hypothetical protein
MTALDLPSSMEPAEWWVKLSPENRKLFCDYLHSMSEGLWARATKTGAEVIASPSGGQTYTQRYWRFLEQQCRGDD